MNRRRISRIGILAAVALAGLALASCSTTTSTNPRDSAEGARPERVELVRLAGSNVGYPSPYAYSKGPGLAQTFLMFDSLLWKDSSGNLLPWLATSWSGSPDGREWTFTLRDGVTWHDGRPFTAEDVVFTFDYITKGAARTALGVIGAVPVTEAVATAPNVVTLRLERPFAPFEEAVAGRVPIVPRHVWADVAEPAKFREPAAVVGTGPYRLEAYDEAAGSYDYVANESYWLGPPYVKRVQFVPAPNELLALQRGEIDIANVTETPDEVLAPLKSDGKYQLITAPGESNTALHFNLTRGFPFDDKRFRQAVAYTVDRADLVKRILVGNGEPGSLANVAPSSPWLAPDIPAYNRDLPRARALLDEAGLRDLTGDGVRDLPDGQAFAPELLATPGQAKTAELIKEYLREVGVAVEVKGVDQAASDSATAEARFDLALVNYGAMASDPDWLRQRLSSRVQSRSFLRIPGYNNPSFEDAAAQQLLSTDPAERLRLVHTMERAVAEDVPLISLYLPTRTAVFSKATFSDWYYTPGGVFGLYPYVLNKHVLATGKQVGI